MVIHALAVDPERSGTGLGKELVRFCIDTAKQSGYKAIRLDIVPTNTPAQHLYESFGFHVCGKRNSYYSDNGEDAYILWLDGIAK